MYGEDKIRSMLEFVSRGKQQMMSYELGSASEDERENFIVAALA